MSPNQLPPPAPVIVPQRDGRGRWRRTPEQHRRNVAFGVKNAAIYRQIKLERQAMKG